MFLFGNKIEKLTKFIVKALTKAIKAGNKIISLYENATGEISTLKGIIAKLEEIQTQIQTNKQESETEAENDLV